MADERRYVNRSTLLGVWLAELNLTRAVTRCTRRLCLRGSILSLNFVRPGLARTVLTRRPSMEKTTLWIARPVTVTVNGRLTGRRGPDKRAVPDAAAPAGPEPGAPGVELGAPGVALGAPGAEPGAPGVAPGAVPGAEPGAPGVEPSGVAPGDEPAAAQMGRVIVLVSSVTALERRVRIRPSTVAPVP
ncbi:MAG: hypothetical protein KY463_15815, partial [Actinobacteria bacterium]|nr:hypothetical protein [Actinomycetota bacterium]